MCMGFNNLMVIHYCTDIPTPVGVRAEVTADNTSIRVSWQWQRHNASICVDLVRFHYLPWRGSHTVGNSTATTSAILPNLQCDTQYTIWVNASGGRTSKTSDSVMVYLPARGMWHFACSLCVGLMNTRLALRDFLGLTCSFPFWRMQNLVFEIELSLHPGKWINFCDSVNL